MLIAAHRFDEASVHCRKLPKATGNSLAWLSRALLQQGKIEDAIRTLEGRTDYGDQAMGVLGVAYARAGRKQEAERLAADLSSPFQAEIFAALGDKGRAFEALDRSIPLGAVRVGRELNYPEFTFMRADPRMSALRKKVCLPE